MSEFRVETYQMSSANLGNKNPLPSLHSPRNESTAASDARGDMQSLAGVDVSQRAYLMPYGALPHRLQDTYDRNYKPRNFQAVVLENEFLKATFLPEIGGRLWSLIHKPTGQELLYVNPVYQPCNLSIRNAWFSGGVEWNCGMIGHSTYTCAPIHAAKVQAGDGLNVLRLYEWCRIRGAVYQMDFYLPDRSPWLLARMRIINPHAFAIPMYWWSNIAVPETGDLRIVCPADQAWTHNYATGELSQNPMLSERTYAKNRGQGAGDGYFAIDQSRRPFVAGLLGDGSGLVQASTCRLRGRKVFVWGHNPGAQRWQEFLSLPGHPYVEIQAGLAPTQMEYLQMPPESQWSWLESYGRASINPDQARHTEYHVAYDAVETFLNKSITQPWMETELVRTEALAELAPTEIINQGQPWGALEMLRRKAASQPPFCTMAMPFDASDKTDQSAPWLALLEKGQLPEGKASDEPGCYMTQPEWLGILEKALNAGLGEHWLSYLHLGVMYYRSMEVDKAKRAWEKSIACRPSAWAYRCLAVIAKDEGRLTDAAELYLQAFGLKQDVWQLAVECCQAQIDAGKPAMALDLLAKMPATLSQRPRLRVLEAKAALDLDQLDRVEGILMNIELTDVREGEFGLSDLWFWMCEKRIAKAQGIAIDDALRERVRKECPPPAKIDFRTFAPPVKKIQDNAVKL
jgi:tetratricopeptide (TPR) repeat protein